MKKSHAKNEKHASQSPDLLKLHLVESVVYEIIKN